MAVVGEGRKEGRKEGMLELVDASETPVCASLACLINDARPTSGNASRRVFACFRERKDRSSVYICMIGN